MLTLSNKKALITGAGRGIGRQIALTLAKAGADVAVSDIDQPSVQETAAEIESLGRKAIAIQADVSKAESVSTMVGECIDTFGTIDILVNNAGITRDGLIMRMKEEDWDLVMGINLKSAFLCCREVARPMMKNSSGKIINIASVVGVMGNAAQVNYSASKAGMIGLTKSLAKELASRSITVNAVAPGFIQSAMTDKLTEQVKENYMQRIPLHRFGVSQDIANVVAFLASPLSDYITGQVIIVDGGLRM
ncbi:MAG: 3-oxoacyl-[acyl-carrier-protein] reductase [Chitinivibrionales bacterium]|nr:3-oxoacyl-[acyl-carrier-protein] reductase [Chitinivibrionales bacterium]